MGIVTSADDVESWEITAYNIIEGEIQRLDELERKKLNGPRRNNRH